MKEVDGQKKPFEWDKWFAWFPILTINKRIIWLCYVERRRYWRWYGTSPDECMMLWEYQRNIED